MFKRKQKRTLDNIGKTIYHFDFQKEIIIYKYLCCNYVNKDKLKELDDKMRFVSYNDWEQYIYNKYKDYNSEQLYQFSKFLNQKKRNIEPNNKYWELIIPVIATLMFTILLELLMKQKIDFDFYGIHIYLYLYLSLADICMVFFTILLIVYIVRPIWKDNIEKSFISDYKEIIDRLIDKKNRFYQPSIFNKRILVVFYYFQQASICFFCVKMNIQHSVYHKFAKIH